MIAVLDFSRAGFGNCQKGFQMIFRLGSLRALVDSRLINNPKIKTLVLLKAVGLEGRALL